MSANGRNTKDFHRDDKELFLRSWWLATKVSSSIAETHATTSPGAWMGDAALQRADARIVAEAIGYSMSFVIDRLREDIETHHGWTDATYDLHLGYLTFLGMGFDQVFGLRREDDSYFTDLLHAYYSPDYGDDYDAYWEISQEVTDSDMKKTLGEFMHDAFNDPSTEIEYNIDRFYTFRLSRIAKVVDRAKVIENARKLYQGVGLRFYDDAFFGLPVGEIEEQLKRMVRE